MGMEDMPFYKRLIDDLAKPRPDLSYKFKTPEQAARQADTPGSVMAGSPAADPVDISYNDNDILPGRPVHPFEVRIMTDEAGNPTKIRCYKGVIHDPETGITSSNTQGSITQELKTSKRVSLQGNRGIVGSGQKDFIPSNYDPGPEQHKYSEYNDPQQTTFRPDYEGGATSGGFNTKKDPTPLTTTSTYATGGYPYNKDTFTTNTSVGAYFEWPYQSNAMIRIFCKNKSDPETREWGIWGNSASPSDLGGDGFFILVAVVSGTEVIQLFASDVVVIGGGGGGAHPLKVVRTGSTGETPVCVVKPGTVNNIIPSNIADSFLLEENELVYLRVEFSADPTSIPVPIAVTIQTSNIELASTDVYAYVKIGVNIGGIVYPLVTGSLWCDRIKVGSEADPLYYFARI